MKKALTLISLLATFSTSPAFANELEFDCACASAKRACGGFERMILRQFKAGTVEASLGDDEFENSETILYTATPKRLETGEIAYQPGHKKMRAFMGLSPVLGLDERAGKSAASFVALLSLEDKKVLRFKCTKY